MYEFVADKIKVIAQIFGWLVLIAGIITAVVFWMGSEPGRGFLALGGGFVGFVLSWILYGFGQLISDVQTIVYRLTPKQ